LKSKDFQTHPSRLT